MGAATKGTGNNLIASYSGKHIKATIKKVDGTVIATDLVKMDRRGTEFRVDDIAYAIASLKDSQDRLILTALPAVNTSKGYVAKFKTTENYLYPLRIELSAPTSEELTVKNITTQNDVANLFNQIDAVYHLNTVLPSN